MAEFFNTDIEYVVDLASQKIHPLAKAAKDTASAGVLMMAIISAIIGLIIFLPKLIDYIGGLL
jgi:diacylglycerol kinase